ncbi:MAG: prolyl oligopeptidase family serine peptidase, partial [Oligosphaeraceae bacterium]
AHVFELLDDLLLDYPIDPTRIYVMGISMGGYGTWDALSRQPERFAAAVPICGGADLAQAPRLARIPIWTFHGDSDTVVPTSRTRDIATAIRTLNPRDFRYTEVPHCGHDSWNAAIRTPELLPWLFAQHR